jgi:hypothetical protein
VILPPCLRANPAAAFGYPDLLTPFLTPATHGPAPMESYNTNFNLNFPLWQYLSQRLFDAEQQLVLNPKAFAKAYRVDFLEFCFSMVSESSNPN